MKVFVGCNEADAKLLRDSTLRYSEEQELWVSVCFSYTEKKIRKVLSEIPWGFSMCDVVFSEGADLELGFRSMWVLLWELSQDEDFEELFDMVNEEIDYSQFESALFFDVTDRKSHILKGCHPGIFNYLTSSLPPLNVQKLDELRTFVSEKAYYGDWALWAEAVFS